MAIPSPPPQQVHQVSNFKDLVLTPFCNAFNAICWTRELEGDFSEIVDKVAPSENIVTLDDNELRELHLTPAGELARNILLDDLRLLKAQGASPLLNIIKSYDRDDSDSFFPTDVYSYHVDRSPIPVDTFLCTYHGEPSQLLPNSQATQKVLIPKIRTQLQQQYGNGEEGFEAYLSEHFYDLHYQASPNATPINLGNGHLWKLAIDHPFSQVAPCIHRAPKEKKGEHRLLMIC